MNPRPDIGNEMFWVSRTLQCRAMAWIGGWLPLTEAAANDVLPAMRTASSQTRLWWPTF